MWNLKKFSNNTAIIDLNKEYSYKDLIIYSNLINKKLSKKKNLILLLTENTIGSLLGYISFIIKKDVPILIDSEIKSKKLEKIINSYEPEYVWMPLHKKSRYISAKYRLIFIQLNYSLFKKKIITQNKILNSKLCLLTTTSGSTGSPKFVRQSYNNIKSNSISIIKYLKMNNKSSTITTLPMSYTFGQSIINTHLYSGGKIVLCNYSIFQKDFWNLFFKHKVSFLYGVPYTFEQLDKLRFFDKNHNFINTIAQAGGGISEVLQKKISQYSRNYKKFFYIMYGQSEATTRIAYLHPSISHKKIGSIGKPITRGKIYLSDNNGKMINTINKVGNLIYKGSNVCLGYALDREDLIKGDEWKNKLDTGDLAKKDKDGLFYIVGRKKRYAKIFGISINLADIENDLSNNFLKTNFLLVSNDKKIFIFYDKKAKILKNRILIYIKKNYNLNSSIFELKHIKIIPRLKSGKKNYMSFLTKPRN